MATPLDVLRARLDGAVVALDYDGVLAPIVARPSDAVPAPGVVDVLAALAARVRTLALVTGRPADVVVALGGLADVPGLVVMGQYGAQRWSDGQVSASDELPGVARARAALPAVIAGFVYRPGPLQNLRLQDEVGEAVRGFAEVAAEAGARVPALVPAPLLATAPRPRMGAPRRRLRRRSRRRCG